MQLLSWMCYIYRKKGKGITSVKVLKKLFVILLATIVTCSGIYMIWTLILPDTWFSELKYVLKTLEDSGIKGSEYTEFDTEYYPYYGFLSDEGKQLYSQVYANAMAYKTTFVPIVEVSVEEAENVIHAVSYDHPELFWMNSGFQYHYTKEDICVQIILEFNHIIKDIEVAKAEFEQRAKMIMEPASALTSDYEKEEDVYQALTTMTEYDESASVNQSAYSALVNGKSVCAGYTRAFQYLMIELGIPTYYCAGMTGGHAWNIIKLDGAYFNVDTTQEKYFNCSDAALSSNYRRSGYSVFLPKCTKAEYQKR